MKKIILTLLLLFGSATAMAQEFGVIKGRLISKSTKQTLAGAVVSLAGEHKLTQTDTSGSFTLAKVSAGSHTVTTNFVGYEATSTPEVIVLANKTTYIEIDAAESNVAGREVVVTPDQYESSPLTPVSSYSFSREEISRNPGAQGDIFRALGMLPGISTSGGEYSAIAVRGQGTHDNVYMVDDIPVLQLSHLEGNSGGFNDPNGGRFSVFAPRVISQAEFQAGGFPAQYGRHSASYVGLSIKEGNREDFVIDGQADLLGLTVNYDGPSYLLDKTSMFVSARYQNFGPLTSVINRKDAGLPIFGDFIFKSSSEIGSSTKLSVIALVSPESYVRDLSNVRADKNLNYVFLLDGKNTKDVFGLNLTSLTSSSTYWKNIAYFTGTAYDNHYGNAYPSTDPNGALIKPDSIAFNSDIQHVKYTESIVGYRSVFFADFKNRSSITGGFDVDRVELTNHRALNTPDTLYIFNDRASRPDPSKYYVVIAPQYYNADFSGHAVNASLYVDYSFQLFDHLTINAGLRDDYSGFAMENTVSPRFSGSYQFDEATSLNYSAGLFTQDPIYSEIADQPADKRLKAEKFTQYILGIKTIFASDWKLSLEGWYKKMNNLVVRPFQDEVEQNNSGTGWAAGLDVSLTKRLTEGLHGTLTYSYMQSKRDDHNGLGEYNFGFSQPHQVTGLIGYTPDDHWVLSSKFRYSTGKPTDEYLIHSDIFSSPNYLRYSAEVIGQNADRLSDFVSLDIRADYTFQFKAPSLTLFLDIVNVLNRQNEYQKYLNIITGKVFYDGLAIFPTFGLKFQF